MSEQEQQACEHAFGVGLNGGGWSLEISGPHTGMWVHAREDCQRPSAATLARLRPVVTSD